jgi:hypothetical protein
MSTMPGKPVSVTKAVYETLKGLKEKTGLSMRQIAGLAIRDWAKSPAAKRFVEKIT